MTLLTAYRLLVIAAIVCFVLALVVELGGSFAGSTGDEWLTGGLLSLALGQATR